MRPLKIVFTMVVARVIALAITTSLSVGAFAHVVN